MTANTIITVSLLIGLFLITLSFVLYPRKTLLMARALFSSRFLQQLLREGKLTNERIYFYPILLHLFASSCLFLVILQFYEPKALSNFSPFQIYGILFGGVLAGILISHLFLEFFTTCFNYQEYKYLYLSIKTIFRFFNVIALLSIIPVVWYAHVPEIIFYGYIPLYVVILFAFFILFLKNINQVGRIHFFIYFCTLEILPYLLLVKLLQINL